jgi:hypothetical protein
MIPDFEIGEIGLDDAILNMVPTGADSQGSQAAGDEADVFANSDADPFGDILG